MPSLRAYFRHYSHPMSHRVGEFFRLVREGQSTETPLRITFRIWAASEKFPSTKIDQNWLDFRDKELEFTTDWFSMRTPAWDWALRHHFTHFKSPRVLEIGSWEGLSANFILKTLPNASLTCVDTWEGSDEHSGHKLGDVEARFDRNVQRFKGRITKWKGRSQDFFRSAGKEKFDFIYVDGSHHFIDVLVDSFLSHEVLRIGGMVVFDDYLWDVYENPRSNARLAINIFIAHHRRSYKVLHAGYQLILKKIR